MTDSVEIRFGENNSEKALVSTSAKSFGEFLKSLIAPKDKMGRNFHGSFCVDKDFITNLYYMIKQRVSEQNRNSLLSEQFSILNCDESAYTFDSVDSFVSHAYTLKKPIIFTNLKMSFSIDGVNGEGPQRHDIEVSFMASSREWIHDRLDEDFGRNNISTCNIRIAYSSRTWAEDLMNMLSNHIKERFKEWGIWKSNIRNQSMLIGSGISLLLTLPIASLLFPTLTPLMENVGPGMIAPIFTEASNISAADLSISLAFWSVLFLFIFFGISSIASYSIRYLVRADKSFLIFNQMHSDERADHINKRNIFYRGVILAFIISVCAGLFVNALLFFR